MDIESELKSDRFAHDKVKEMYEALNPKMEHVELCEEGRSVKVTSSSSEAGTLWDLKRDIISHLPDELWDDTGYTGGFVSQEMCQAQYILRPYAEEMKIKEQGRRR